MKTFDQDIPDLIRDGLGKGERGKYLKYPVQGSNVVVLLPEIQKAFTTSVAVEKVLASKLAFAQLIQGFTVRSSPTRRKRMAA